MGLEISKDAFDDSEFEAFQRKLEVDLAALGALLGRPRFGEGAATVGAEVELMSSSCSASATRGCPSRSTDTTSRSTRVRCRWWGPRWRRWRASCAMP